MSPTKNRAIVDRLEASAYTIPTEQPESDATLTWTKTTVVVPEVAAGGREGIGFTYGSAACVPVIESILAEVVVGSDAMVVPATWAAMICAVRNAGRPGIASTAIAAVDIALWDLKSRLLDLPLVTLLGQIHDSVAVYGSGAFTSYTDRQLVEQLSGWVHDAGIPRVKMKVGTAWGSRGQQDLDRVASVRQAIGPDAELYVDANGGYGRKQAVRQARVFSEIGVTWFEEPVSSDDLAGLAEIRDLCDCDIAAGEYGFDLSYFERMCEAGAVDVVQADVSRCAGITEWLRIAGVAAAHGLDIRGTARKHSTSIRPAQWGTSGTLSTSTTTPASTACSSTASPIRQPEYCSPISRLRASASP